MRRKTRLKKSVASSEPLLPILSNSKIVEGRSRTIFDQAVSPWMVTQWHSYDLGIDAIVEIASRPFGEEIYNGTGKRFAVQLKATEGDIRQCGSVQVSVDKIYYWHEATEPTLLVTCHLPSQEMFSRWIDDDLILELDKKSPEWRSQKTLTITVDTTRPLGRPGLRSIENYVRSLRRVPTQSLKPGVYLKALSVATKTVDGLLSAAKGLGFESVENRLKSMEVALRRCTYEVAITGPSRAGKSTLINALLGVEISPVDSLPTTAVAIRAQPGDRDEAEVVFRSGKRLTGPPTSEFLMSYATQGQNEDNRKKVEIINVRLVNPILAQGLAFLDAPGLHDPSPEIRAITAAALERANAVIYVLEVASAATGGFSLPNQVIEDIKKLQGAAERLFLILNKADALDEATRKKVESFVASTLKKYGIWKQLPHPPIFISAQEAWQWRVEGSSGASPCKELEDVLWRHLLETSATGSKRVALLLQETGRAGEGFASLLATRRLSSSKALQLEQALTSCTQNQGRIIGGIRSRISDDETWANSMLPSLQSAVTDWLRRRLESVPVEQELPDWLTLREELQKALILVTDEAWKRIASRLSAFASQTSREIETILQQARLTVGVTPALAVETPSLDTLEIPSGKTFEEAVVGMIGLGLFGLIFGGWGFAVGVVGGWIAGFVLGKKSQRQREIAHNLSKVEPKISKVVESFGAHAAARVRSFGNTLEGMVNDRIGVYVHDARNQLQKTGQAFSQRQSTRHKQVESQVKDIMDAHEKQFLELLPAAMKTTTK
jgi:GTP-binding protein EngB required for normal cell division